MKLDLIVSPQAWEDVDEVAAYIEKGSPSSAIRFFDACWETFEQLSEHPGIGPEVEDIDQEWHGLRKWAIHGFLNYIVFYRISQDRLEIVHVHHGAQDPQRFFRSSR